MFKVRTDGMIFMLQSFGGISVYANEVLPKSWVLRLTTSDCRRIVKLLGFFRLIFPAVYLDGTKHIFHSSYYRYSINKNAYNVVTVHDFNHYSYGKGFKTKLFRWVQSRAILKADAIICVSITTMNEMFEKFPLLDRQKIHYVPNGISKHYLKQNLIEDLAIKKEVILYVGDRKADYKNFHLAVELANRVGFKLLIVGGGELTNTELNILQALIFEHKLWLTERELIKAYTSSYVLIYPSEKEGFGIPIIEAQICSCPVLAMNTSCIPEISGGSALLCDGSISDFVSAFYKLKDEKFYRELLREGYENARKYNWSNTKEKTELIYHLLLNQ